MNDDLNILGKAIGWVGIRFLAIFWYLVCVPFTWIVMPPVLTVITFVSLPFMTHPIEWIKDSYSELWGIMVDVPLMMREIL